MTRSLALVPILLVVFTAAAGANPPAVGEIHGPFFDTLDLNVTSLEVVAQDAHGHRVTDLGRGDFELYEDGQRVPIDYFFRVVPPTVAAPAVTGVESVPASSARLRPATAPRSRRP